MFYIANLVVGVFYIAHAHLQSDECDDAEMVLLQQSIQLDQNVTAVSAADSEHMTPFNNLCSNNQTSRNISTSCVTSQTGCSFGNYDKKGLYGVAESNPTLKIKQHEHDPTILCNDRQGTNPSLVRVPPIVRSMFGDEVEYMATLKNFQLQCHNFGHPYRRHLFGDMVTFKSTSSVILLDRNLTNLGSAHIDQRNAFGVFQPGYTTDLRLIVLNDTVWITGRFYPVLYGVNTIPNRMHRLILEKQGDGFRAFYDETERHDLPGINNGVFVSGGMLQILDWPRPLTIINTSMPSLLQFRDDPSRVHNNIHPLHLPERKEYLIVVHTHEGSNGFTWYGTRYRHQYITISDTPPFIVTAQSNEFCISAIQSTDDCEAIQFVMSVVRMEDNPNKVLMSYGINDCEAAVIKLDLSDILGSLIPVDNVSLE